MKIKAITTFRGWKDGSDFTYESVYSVEEIEVSPGVSLWDQVARVKDWYEVVEQDGEDTLITTKYYGEDGILLAKDEIWASEIRDEENWEKYRVSYSRRKDPGHEIDVTFIAAPRVEYVLDTFYGIFCLREGFARDALGDFRLGSKRFVVRAWIEED